VDSTLAGRLAQLAVEQMRQEGREASFGSIRGWTPISSMIAFCSLRMDSL
jgi:hypothetical protein